FGEWSSAKGFDLGAQAVDFRGLLLIDRLQSPDLSNHIHPALLCETLAFVGPMILVEQKTDRKFFGMGKAVPVGTAKTDRG
ncbi:MAG: hypothetical protein JJU29_14495, partial [Verrucomicrobia bacterium]|nr:hypothetical protein [Verrucomicrobiota bacterium]